MKPPPPMPAVLQELFALANLEGAAEDQAVGVIGHSPVTMTGLRNEPLGLLFAFRVRRPHPPAIDLPEDVARFVAECSGEVSVENGYAWLSLDNLHGKSAGEIAAVLERFDVALDQAGIRVPAGCVECGSGDDAILVYSGRRCSRLCRACRAEAEENAAETQANLDRPSVRFAAFMPAVFLGVSCGWAAVWFGVELYLLARGMNQLWIAYYDIVLILAALAAVAGVLGYPLGVFLRRSGLARRAPVIVAVTATLVACLFGEWLFVNALIVHRFGIVEPIAATRSFFPYVTGYSPSWVFGKLLVAAAIGGGASLAAIMRPFVEPKV